MVLNAAQIQEAERMLKEVLAEQERILGETRQIVHAELSGAWECLAQKAYAEAFDSLEMSTLNQINSLIGLFGTAFVQSQNGLHQVDVDLASMTSNPV